MIRFSVDGIPVPQGSMRGFSVRGRVHMTSDNKGLYAWRNWVAQCARDAYCDPPLSGPVHVRLEFVMPRPASVKLSKRPLPCTKPDIDKLTRAILDAITGIAWNDDGQVTTVTARKSYNDAWPVGVRVEIDEDFR